MLTSQFLEKNAKLELCRKNLNSDIYGLYFLLFRLDMEIYRDFRIQSECGEIQAKETASLFICLSTYQLWSKFYKKSWIIGTNLGQSQSAFTCSKSTMETLEQCVQFVQKLTIKTPEWCQWGVFTVNFEQISQIAAMLIITLDITQSEALLGTSETFKTELFAKMINS